MRKTIFYNLVLILIIVIMSNIEIYGNNLNINTNDGNNTFNIYVNEEKESKDEKTYNEYNQNENSKVLDERNTYVVKDIKSSEYVNLVVLVGETSKYYAKYYTEDQMYTRENYEIEPVYKYIYSFKVKREDLNLFEIICKRGRFYPFKYIESEGKSRLYIGDENSIKNETFDTLIYEVLNPDKNDLEIELKVKGKEENLIKIEDAKKIIQESSTLKIMKEELEVNKIMKNTGVFIIGSVMRIIF